MPAAPPRPFALMLLAATLGCADPTAPAGATGAAIADDGELLPGLFQEKIDAAISAGQWAVALDLIDAYLAVVQRTARVTTDDGRSYRDVRTLSGFRDQVIAAARQYDADRTAAGFRADIRDHLQRAAREAADLELGDELAMPLNQREIAAIRALMINPDTGVRAPPWQPLVGKQGPVPISASDRQAVAVALTVDEKSWSRAVVNPGHDDVYVPHLYVIPLPAGNPTPFTAVRIADCDDMFYWDFVGKNACGATPAQAAP